MQKGPLCTSVCCVAVLGVLFPLTTTMFHVVKGGHVYSFLFLKKSVAETRLCLLPQPTQQAAL